MESIISNDTFEAFRTENGIEIQEKKAATKKFSIVVIVSGIIMTAISFIPMEGLTYEWITTLFTTVFFYGGILLIVLGLITLIVKGMGDKQAPVTTFNKHQKVLTVRKREYPFAEMEEIKIQTAEVMNRRMTTMMFKYKGRNRGLIAGTVFTTDITELENFVDELNTLIKDEDVDQGEETTEG